MINDTQNAKIDLIKKFLDYANVADASYALLHYINEIIQDDKKKGECEKGDGQTFGATYNNHNSTYARAIEARFNEDKVGDWCIPLTDKCFMEKDKITNNDIAKIALDFKLSKRTKDFTNRFKLLKHQPNEVRVRGEKDSDGNYGFSATLFEDTQAVSTNSQYILVCRGTESRDDFLTDHILAEGGIPMQCYFLVKFYEEQVRKQIGDIKLVVVGHSLGGYLAQSFCFMYPNRVAELYTFNSPGLYPDKKITTSIQVVDKIIEFDAIKLYATLNQEKLNNYMALSMFNRARKSNYNEYVYNINNLVIEPQEIKEQYHQKILLLQNGIQKSINTDYAYLPESLKNIPIHHIKTDEDSNPNNNDYLKNFIQYLGEDIAGKHYYINLGVFSGSHFILPTIHSLQKALMHMNSGNVDNLLEYNKIKDLKDESMFLRMNRNRKDEQISQMQANVFNSLQNLRY